MKLTIFTQTSIALFSLQTWVSTLVARLMSFYTEGGGFPTTKSLLTTFLMASSVVSALARNVSASDVKSAKTAYEKTPLPP